MMNKVVCKFEYLPNEILIEIFKYLDIRDSFHGFYDLNFRLNILLQSIDHCLTVISPDSNQSNNDEIYLPYIDTLIIKNGIDIKFEHVINARRVILHYNPTHSMINLQINLASNIEYLSILSNHIWLLSFSKDFIRKIFSNAFPYLKSCCLLEKTVILYNDKWTTSPSIRIFTVGYIRSRIFQSILSSCPNLYFLKFTKWSMDPSTCSVEPHMNLKHLVITISLEDFLDSNRLKNHFLSVPKLEQLHICTTLRDPPAVVSIEDSHWFSNIIESHLPTLQKFSCDIIFAPRTNMNKVDHDNVLNKMRENFQQAHKSQYISKIAFKFL